MRQLKIMLDPGHGGWDSGAVANFGSVIIKEGEINLTVARLVALKLKKEGFDIHMTRWRDLTRTLWIRCSYANIWDADIFLSIHANSFTTPEPRGFEVHHYPGSLNGRLVARGIIGEYLKLVEAVKDLVVHGTGLFASNFYVLRKTKMPAALIELGFLSNREDLDILTSPSLVGMIAGSITNYLCSDQLRGMIT